MATNKTHGSFEDILRVAGPRLSPLCKALRNLVASLDEDYFEVVWPRHKIASFGVGPRKMTEHYAYIGVQDAYVNLGFYHGASLDDPDGVLEGTGKQLRPVKVRNLTGAKNPALKGLVLDAIAERRRYNDRVRQRGSA